jgi:hypothetical protein
MALGTVVKRRQEGNDERKESAFLQQVQLFSLDLVPSLAAMLGHLQVGVACYSNYFNVLNLPCDRTQLRRACCHFALLNGIPTTTLVALQEVANPIAHQFRLGAYDIVPYDEVGTGTCMQIVEWLTSVRGQLVYNGAQWVDFYPAGVRPEQMRQLVEKLWMLAFSGPLPFIELLVQDANVMKQTMARDGGKNIPQFTFADELSAAGQSLINDLYRKKASIAERKPTQDEIRAVTRIKDFIKQIITELPLGLRLNAPLLKHALRDFAAAHDLL